MFENVKRGADPELFLKSSITNLPVTSIGRIGGSKDEPRPIIAEGFGLQEDNVAVEFNIPPASNKQEFIGSIHRVLDYLRQELQPQNLELVIEPTMEFTEEQLDHPQAQALGCEPDFNAWTQDMNPRPKAPPTLRSSGGHLHLSWDKPKNEERLQIIRVHDLFCGAPSLLFDTNTLRREIYGKAGAFRPKKYGAEYRTMSNYWISSEELTDMIYTQSEKAFDFLRNGGSIAEEHFSVIQDCVNNSDRKLFDLLNEAYSII